jgi:hypothetical protein
MINKLRLLVFCFNLIAVINLNAQQISSSYERPLSDYTDNDKALSDFETAITKGTDDFIWGNLGIAQYYARIKKDSIKVYRHANDALERLMTLKSDQKQNLRKRFISSTKLKNLRDSAITQIYERMEKQKTRAAYQQFLDDYPRPR